MRTKVFTGGLRAWSVLTVVTSIAGAQNARADVTVNVVVTGDLTIEAGINHEMWTQGTVNPGSMPRRVFGNLTIRGGKSRGTACLSAGECWDTDYCEDGVCCCANGCCDRTNPACIAAEQCAGGCSACGATGLACALAPATQTCRPGAGPCDVAERCTGSGPNCPSDGFVVRWPSDVAMASPSSSLGAARWKGDGRQVETRRPQQALPAAAGSGDPIRGSLHACLVGR